ncbi:zinc ABC transporter substrate-binding protein [Aliivibrio fischeri]|uniref:zinc ABC transporter substrate-binding protein n=1 Tax=Aliivibrio fischeri TaxID=668 RepID=UPI001F1C730F|nr:zinc ABC transporter substrate-binding protein [Aliivibrio fischeri]MCE7537485.1 zinc ABC transporter substrate-binding protein [Aliivibrio fischeri]MCE7560379.1 zinc ABC transporter substrate-binding protein [Aliivibrio fischeri]
MFKKAISVFVMSLAVVSQSYAQAPKVVVDIAPLHSLVTQVMDGVGEPDLLIRPEMSPHSYHLRPSEAKALSQADIVFWVGEGLTPWLEKPLSSLAGSATQIEMIKVEGVTLYDFREGATFEAHEHHDDARNDHEEEHNEHSKDHEHHHHDGHDPHVWLDPKNAEVWVNIIAKTLSDADSSNAPIYQKNAKITVSRLHKLSSKIKQQAKGLEGVKFIVFHDAYQYFEKRFQLLASGAISISDASKPSPARITDIRDTVKKLGVTCVFTEPQYNPELVNSIFDNSTVKTIGTMDPLGANLAIGKDQYDSLLMSMIESLSQCKP